jgi:hypothetical protein
MASILDIISELEGNNETSELLNYIPSLLRATPFSDQGIFLTVMNTFIER